MRFLADENLNGRIVRGLLRRVPALDLVRVQDVGLSGASDPEVLAWAALENRILLTHDANTVPFFAYRRVQARAALPGVFIIPADAPTGVVIDDVLLLHAASRVDEWSGQVLYLPLG